MIHDIEREGLTVAQMYTIMHTHRNPLIGKQTGNSLERQK